MDSSVVIGQINDIFMATESGGSIDIFVNVCAVGLWENCKHIQFSLATGQCKNKTNLYEYYGCVRSFSGQTNTKLYIHRAQLVRVEFILDFNWKYIYGGKFNGNGINWIWSLKYSNSRGISISGDF